MSTLLKTNPKSKFDIKNENFDEYCRLFFSKLTPAQKELLPYDIVKRLKRPDRMTFLQKVYIISVAFGKEAILLLPPIGDDDTISLNDLVKIKNTKNSIEDSDFLLNKVGFALSSKEVIETFAKAHTLSISPAARYLLKIKNGKHYVKGDSEKFREQVMFISKLLTNYDLNRKRMLVDNTLTMTDWYALQYLHDGTEKSVYPMAEKYKSAFGASQRSITTSFPKLKHKGLAERTQSGNRSTVRYRITTKGLALYNDIMSKYITNF